MLTTNIRQLRDYRACWHGLKTLMASLPEDHSPDAPITLAHILESNGLEHAVWALRTQDKKYAVQFAWRCAERATKQVNKSAVDCSVWHARYAASAESSSSASDAAVVAARVVRGVDECPEKKEQEKIYLEIVNETVKEER